MLRRSISNRSRHGNPRSLDFFGNRMIFIELAEPHAHLKMKLAARVAITPPEWLDPEATAAWETVRDLAFGVGRSWSAIRRCIFYIQAATSRSIRKSATMRGEVFRQTGRCLLPLSIS